MEDESHEAMRSLVAAYVLGAVPAGEEPSIRAHLLTCEECLAEADSYASAASQLALAVEPVPPAAGLEDRVLERVRSERVEATRISPAPRRRSVLAWAFGLACLLLVAGLGAAYLAARSDLEEQKRIASALLRGDEGLKLRGDGVAAVIPTEDGAVFVAEGLSAPPEDHTYQLWLLEGTEPVSGGTFEVDDGLAVVDVDRSLEGFDGAAVTVEPDGGSPAPTTEPVVKSAT
jgi:anti-sigma-K factor RskA